MKQTEFDHADLTKELLWSYALGLLPEQDMAEIEIHCAHCEDCATQAAEQVILADGERKWSAVAHGEAWRTASWQTKAVAALQSPSSDQTGPTVERAIAFLQASASRLQSAATVVWKAPERAGKRVIESLEAVVEGAVIAAQATGAGAEGVLAEPALAVRGAVQCSGGPEASPPDGTASISFSLPAGMVVEIAPGGEYIDFFVQSGQEDDAPAVLLTRPGSENEEPKLVLPHWDDARHLWHAQVQISGSSGEFVVVPVTSQPLMESDE